MKRKLIITLSFLSFIFSGVQAFGKSELLIIKANYKRMLVPPVDEQDSLLRDLIMIEQEKEMSDQVVIELHQRYPFDLDRIKQYISCLTDKGFWTDINYEDTKRSGWEPKQHAERILELTKVYYSKQTPYYQSEIIKKTIHTALNFWFTQKPKSLNWWYNQIGIPKTLGAAFILFEDQLSAYEKSEAIKVMESSTFGMTGQNKVWLAGNVLIRALLQNDEYLVKAARETIASEIVLGQVEGIKNDWSFHQHGPQQQLGNYGLSFISNMSFFAVLFKGTSYEFDKERMNILDSLINEGYRWVIWNRYMDISSLGRQLFHHAQIHKAYSLAFTAADLGLEGFPKNANTLVGYKHFEDSDYTIHRSRDWMSSLKMSSNRVIGTELVNEDNLKGYYLGDGATFFYNRGDEYLDIFPFWDWRKIPGITAFEDVASIPSVNVSKSRNKTDKVGGGSNGTCGMSVMELDRDNLRAKKAWLFADSFVICMGSNIYSDSALCVTTSIDQRLKRSELFVLNGKEWMEVKDEMCFSQKELRFFHDRTGYIVLGKDSCVAQVGKRTGRWCDIMKMYRPVVVENEIVALHLRHGMKPDNATYLYVVIPSCDRGTIMSFDVNAIKVLRNDGVAQILSVPSAGKGYWIAAYQSGSLNMEDCPFFVETPGIYYVERSFDGFVIKQMTPFRQT